MKQSQSTILGFSGMAVLVIAIALLVFSCKKETTTITATEGFTSSCDYLYGISGYIVQEDGIINFRDASSLVDFLNTVPTWSDSSFITWESSIGSNTVYGNYIEADHALAGLYDAI